MSPSSSGLRYCSMIHANLSDRSHGQDSSSYTSCVLPRRLKDGTKDRTLINRPTTEIRRLISPFQQIRRVDSPTLPAGQVMDDQGFFNLRADLRGHLGVAFVAAPANPLRFPKTRLPTAHFRTPPSPPHPSKRDRQHLRVVQRLHHHL